MINVSTSALGTSATAQSTLGFNGVSANVAGVSATAVTYGTFGQVSVQSPLGGATVQAIVIL